MSAPIYQSAPDSTITELPADVQRAADADHAWAVKQRDYHKVHHTVGEHRAIDWEHQDMLQRLHHMVHRWREMDDDAIRREVELRHEHDLGMIPLLGSLQPALWLYEIDLRAGLMHRHLSARKEVA